LEDRINIIMDDARAAGWSTEEIAVAIVDLANNLVLGQRANDDMEAVFDLARQQD
jgi:hypothetical protein